MQNQICSYNRVQHLAHLHNLLESCCFTKMQPINMNITGTTGGKCVRATMENALVTLTVRYDQISVIIVQAQNLAMCQGLDEITTQSRRVLPQVLGRGGKINYWCRQMIGYLQVYEFYPVKIYRSSGIVGLFKFSSVLERRKQ